MVYPALQGSTACKDKHQSTVQYIGTVTFLEVKIWMTVSHAQRGTGVTWQAWSIITIASVPLGISVQVSLVLLSAAHDVVVPRPVRGVEMNVIYVPVGIIVLMILSISKEYLVGQGRIVQWVLLWRSFVLEELIALEQPAHRYLVQVWGMEYYLT